MNKEINVEEMYDHVKSSTNAINGLYAIFKTIYDNLLKKSDESYCDAKFIDVMDFGIATNALSILKNLLLDNVLAKSNILNMRNIIEYLALRKMYENNKVSKDSEKLLTIQCFIDDYYMYINNLKGEEYKNIIDIKKLEDDFNHCKEEYNEMGYSDNFIKYNKLQFLLKKNIQFKQIVKDYLNDYYLAYQYLSIFVHPHNFLITDRYENYVKKIFCRLMEDLTELYLDDKVDINNLLTKQIKKCFNYYKDKDNSKNGIYYKLLLGQTYLLDKLVHKMKDNQHYQFIVSLIENYERILEDVNTDDLLGLTASCKIKLKTILEMFAVQDKLFINNINYNNEVKLFNYHILLSLELLKNPIDVKYVAQIKQKVYSIYKNIYPNSKMTFKEFIKAFQKNLGYFIDEKGITPSYLTIVRDYLAKMYKDAKTLDKGILLKDFFFLEYAESIKMQHGNGYLYFANPGTFNDSKNVLIIVDDIFKSFLFRFNICDSLFFEGNDKTINTLIKETLEEWDKIINEKIKLFK